MLRWPLVVAGELSRLWCWVGVSLVATLPGSAQLQPFVLPWNGASTGITDLRPWQPEPAGANGWVTVNGDGHYEVAGERIRFLGVNIGAGAAFPSYALADIHAARLARFGVNNVRLHHLEAPWEPHNVLIDYASGSSRQLSADRLDRLQYFVAALAGEGVYSNINLLVSREFKATDGLGPEITQLGWKDQHILGFFSDAALALHQEHATNLLTAPNPHRGGVPFAQDPAVAVVEIMNENGLAQKWYESVLDTMPAVYRAQLAARWNAWLQARYASTAAMLTSWGAVNEPPGANILANGNFDAGTAGWNAEQHDVAVATFTRTTEFTGGASSVRINVTSPGSEGWHVQFNQGGRTLVGGQVYTVSFWIRASVANTPYSATISKAYTDWSQLAPGRSGTVGPTWTQVTWTFQSGVDDTNARLNFGGFGDRAVSVWLADVRFSPGGQIGGLPAGTSLEDATVPNVPRVPGLLGTTTAQQRDWMACLNTLERDYWSAMDDHVKTTLGYAGLVWGTINANSPPNTQAGFDAMDSHVYWQHPQFPPGQDWDPVNWTVNNISMVNDANGGTLGGLARQRVQGYPHNVTEYQHSSPNTYSSEAPLLVAAYGALQDWDGLWLFDYTTVDAANAGRINGYFDQAQHPTKMANMVLAAALFRRGDVTRARKNYVMPFPTEREIDVLNSTGSAWSVADGSHLGVPAALALVSRVALDIGASATGLEAPPSAPSGSTLVSDTGELIWNTARPAKGVVTVNTARTRAVIGFVDGRSFDLGGVILAPGTTRQDWCTLGVTLLEGTTFDHASGGRALIVATGDVENTGMVWTSSAHNSVGTNWGTAPTVVEVVPATITLPVAASRLQGWALDGSGQRAGALTISDVGGRAQVTLGNAGATLWYELAIAPGAPVAPVVTTQPMSLAVPAGAAATLSAGVDGHPAPSIQWYRNGQPVVGATQATLSISSVGTGEAGDYHAVAQNTVDSVSTRTVRLAVTSSGGGAGPEQLVNVSTRAPTLIGPEVMIGGFVVSGTQPREVLIRAIGPGLAAYGVTGVLPDPQLELFRHGEQTPWQSNDNWDPLVIGDLFTQLGAFALTDEREACLRVQLAPGSYTAHLSGVGGATGTALFEVYDAGGGDGRIVNLSTRGHAGPGGEGLIVGFVIKGTAPKRVLIRGIGPGLSGYGVDNVVADPRLVLDRLEGGGAIALLTNDDWEDDDAAAIAAATQATGAFSLPLTSNDAALLVWLEPGTFTARAEAKGAAGVGLVEVYELP